mmetsp:Transcript_1960/g.4235  ORF Transcript_1960/g.4235 Transcript_1960/m.4235 type:complete len:213 (+) Transcript_1960:1708-2346(+)
MHKLPDHLGDAQPLLHVEERGDLVEHVHVGITAHSATRGKALQLSPTELLDLPIQHVTQFQSLHDFVHDLPLVTHRHQFPHRLPREAPRETSLQLRFDHDPELVLQHPREVVLQVRPPVVRHNVRPVRQRRGAPSQVWLSPSQQYRQGGGFSRTVGPKQPQHVPRPGDGQSVDLKRVRAVPVGRVRRQIGRELHDGHGVPRTLLAPAHAGGA